MRWALAITAGLLLLTGCDDGPAKVNFFADRNPDDLAEWGVVTVSGGHLDVGERVEPYDIVTPLFSDYASKFRTIYLPAGQAAKYDSYQAFDFPVGTIISKTFYYPKGKDGTVRPVIAHGNEAKGLDLGTYRLMETRLLVRREAGWVALPYIWDEDQKHAHLAPVGDILPITFEKPDGGRQDVAYVVPNMNQCASCHSADYSGKTESRPLGLKARHLNHDFAYAAGPENELAHLTRIGYLTGAPEPSAAPRNADWQDTSAPLEARARAYLDANCGHCHNAKGLARTTGLYLDAGAETSEHIGLCKPPVAAGPGTGDLNFDIMPGQPDKSIMVYRMTSTKPAVMMPELGRATEHEEGVALIRAWITAWRGDCGA